MTHSKLQECLWIVGSNAATASTAAKSGSWDKLPGRGEMNNLPANRPRILLADDHAIFTDLLRSLLEKSYTVVGTVTDGRELLSKATEANPDLIVVDVGMPVLNGFDAARLVRQILPKVGIVFLTMRDEANLAAAVFELGSVGFVLKHSAATELVTAIESVLKGTSYITPRLRTEDRVERAARAKQFAKGLTPRQREVLQLFAEGRAAKEIAARLGMNQKTVEFHKYHIMQMLDIKSNADLVRFAIRHGLVAL